jgi:probable HAF family extracellular repeat protein
MGRIRSVPACVMLSVAVSLYVSSTSVAGMCRFQGIGDLPGGNFYSKAYGISTDGSVIVGETESGSRIEGFRWTELEGMMGLGNLTGSDLDSSRAYGVSADGSVIVGSSKPAFIGAREAFRWENGVMTGLGDLPGSFFSSRAYSLSADGSVVVGESESGSGTEAFRWTQAEGMVGLGGGGGSIAYGVSADGSVIVGTCRSTKTSDDEAFRWTQAEGIVGLGFLVPPDPMNALNPTSAV